MTILRDFLPRQMSFLYALCQQQQFLNSMLRVATRSNVPLDYNTVGAEIIKADLINIFSYNYFCLKEIFSKLLTMSSTPSR